MESPLSLRESEDNSCQTRRLGFQRVTPMAAFQTSSEGNIQILSISGRLDPNNWRDLKDTISALTEGEGKNHLLIELNEMEYMASAGFREFFMAGRALARRGGKLAVCGLTGEVRRIFEIAKFDTAYPIFEDRAAGLEFLRGQ